MRRKHEWDTIRRKIDDVIVGLALTANVPKDKGRDIEAETLVKLATHLQEKDNELFRVSLIL